MTIIRDCTFLGGAAGWVTVEDGTLARVEEGSAPDPPPGATVIDAAGGTLLPGLVDSHCHPFEYGWLKRSVDLRGTSNITGVRMRLSSRVLREPPGAWVTGMGWDQESFPDRRMPTRRDIDDVSPRNPVALSRVCGHIALLNSRAMEALGLESSQDPQVERDASGSLTGIVKEDALVAVQAGIPKSEDRAGQDLLSVETEAARVGLTAMHAILSPDAHREELRALATLARSGNLTLAYRAYLPPAALEELAGTDPAGGADPQRLAVNGVKLFADGSLGARTAALREPYSDDPGNLGILRHSDEEMENIVERADAAGYQVIMHAIGDRAAEQAIDALARVTGAKNPRRHRIEHASLLPPDLRSKMARHGIRASVQPMFVSSDVWAVERLGEERMKDLYPFRSMLGEGLTLSGGSDSPVETLSPVLGIWAAMAAPRAGPDESLTFPQAVSLYTSGARSNGLQLGGELVPGAPADLTLFDSNIDGLHPALFRKVGVSLTMVAGTVVYSSSPADAQV